jgi:hypothetical protein
MGTGGSRRIAAVVRAAVLALLIGLVGQGAWTALVAINLKTSAEVSWAVAVMAAVLWTMWQYLGGRWAPRSNSQMRRRLLRANPVRGAMLVWALAAGAMAVTALAGLWMASAQVVRMPGSVLPAMSQYPPITAVSMVAMGALVSPILEQAGLWGYCQKLLERDFSAPVAIAITAAIFALLPHPPFGAPVAVKLTFFFLIGASFGAIAYLCDSILPSLAVHIGGIVIFFTVIWPADVTRPIGMDSWFWIHAAQALAFGILALAAFARLSKRSRAKGAFAEKENSIIAHADTR